MKNWMALLLGCLLCWCAAGAMAELGTLELDDTYAYNIYPDGYQKGVRNIKGFFPEGDFQVYTGPYIITGTSTELDTCLDFHSLPHQSSGTTEEPVEYTVTFQNANIQSYQYCTALRFGNGEGDSGKDITLNLINCGSSRIDVSANFPVFSNAGQKNVLINLHNAKGASLTYYSRNSGIAALYNQGATLRVEGVFVTETNLDDYRSLVNSITNKWKIDKTGTLQRIDRTEPTCTAEGQQEHWTCSGCDMLFLDADGSKVTTSQALTLPARHDLTKVEAKAPTCTEDGHTEYWVCTREGCGKLFADAQGRNETMPEAVTLPAGHALTLVPRKDPTYTADGHIEHYRCTREGCGKLFADAEGKQELSANDVILAKLVRTDILPQTGDTSHLLGWAALLGACCAGLWCLNRRRG